MLWFLQAFQVVAREMGGGSPGRCTAAVSSKTGYTSLLRTLDRICHKISKHCNSITSAMIVDMREVHNVSQYARMLQFICSIMQLCGGFEPELLLQPKVRRAPPRACFHFADSADVCAVPRAALGGAGRRHAV